MRTSRACRTVHGDRPAEHEPARSERAPRMTRRSGKGFPDALRAQPDLPRASARVRSPCLLYRAVRSGKYREGWAEKFLGKAPLRIGDRPCVWFHAVSVGEVLLLRPIVARAGAAAAGLGGRRLDDDARPAWRWPGGPIPTWSPSTPRSTSAGRRGGPSRGSGRRSWRWSSWSSGRTWSGRRSGPGRGWRSSTAGSARGATAAIGGSAGRSARRFRRLDAVAVQTEEYADAVRRPGRPPAAGPGDRLGQVRRPGERPEQPEDAGPAPGARALAGRPGLRGRQHDGGRRGGRAGGLPGRPACTIRGSGWCSCPATPSGSSGSRPGSSSRASRSLRRSEPGAAGARRASRRR